MRVSLHSNLMREQTQLQPRLHPWHLETSDLCISSRDLVLFRPICTELAAVRKELSQHNQRSSSTGRDRSKKSQAPNSDQVAQNFGQSDSWNPPKTDPPAYVPSFHCSAWSSKHPNGTIPASFHTHCFFFSLTVQSCPHFSAIFSQALEGCSWYSKPSHVQSGQLSSASLSSEAPCYEMCWVPPFPMLSCALAHDSLVSFQSQQLPFQLQGLQSAQKLSRMTLKSTWSHQNQKKV